MQNTAQVATNRFVADARSPSRDPGYPVPKGFEGSDHRSSRVHRVLPKIVGEPEVIGDAATIERPRKAVVESGNETRDQRFRTFCILARNSQQRFRE